MVEGDAYVPTLTCRRPITPSKGARSSVCAMLDSIRSMSAFRVASSVFTCSYASLLTASLSSNAFWRNTRSSASFNCDTSLCNCAWRGRSFTLASNCPFFTKLPSSKFISIILPEVSNERSTSSSGSRLPLICISSFSSCGLIIRAFTFSTFLPPRLPVITLSAAANSSFVLGSWE